MKKKMVLGIAMLALSVGIAASVATAGNASDQNGNAKLVHVGLNPPECVAPFTNTGTEPSDSGVVNVHYNVVQDRFTVNLSVHGALPNTTYVLDVRCWTFTNTSQDELGTLTTNSQGTGTAQFKVSNVTPTAGFYIDISVKGGGGGAGGYGDTFIAGPFTLS